MNFIKMNSTNGYIYVRNHPSYDVDDACKMGKGKNKVGEYLLLYLEIKKHYLNLSIVSNDLVKIDALFSPKWLWVEYYNVKDLRDIITITNKKKKSSSDIL